MPSGRRDNAVFLLWGAVRFGLDDCKVDAEVKQGDHLGEKLKVQAQGDFVFVKDGGRGQSSYPPAR